MKSIQGYTEAKSGLRIFVVDKASQKDKERIARTYKKFYQDFCTYLYAQGYFDNYVGLIIKCLRSFFNYLKIERNLSVGEYHRLFYVPIEQIPIIALSPAQLRYIMHDPEFIQSIQESRLEEVRDIFIFGCCVALRVSDLLALSPKNLIRDNGNQYIRVRSLKTRTDTQVKLPDYAIDIIKKYKGKQKGLLPQITKEYLNSRLKEMSRLVKNNTQVIKTRERRGRQVVIYKNAQKKEHFTLADLISTHTMRRTGITTMLSLGMAEHLVRRISGHAANSKEFFRYVELAQEYIDTETDKVFKTLSMK